MQYGLIGQTLGHSYSKTLHGLLCDYDYQLTPLAPEELDGFLTARAFDGVNVTIPYKRAVIPYCAALSDAAQEIGSVNTLLRRKDNSLYGDNTDAYGFAMLAKSAGIDFAGKKTLVLGSGGTSRTVCHVVKEQGGTPVVISRRGENTYDTVERHGDAAIVVNATPVGMYPGVDASPLDLDRLPGLTGVLDVIYNPLRTPLIQQAVRRGLPCAGGLAMLAYQAARACELFTGKTPDAARALAALRLSAQNLVLVGMPGCGKTTVGKALQALSGLPLVDMDEEIARRAHMAIPAIFETEGECGFRKREAEIIAQYGKERGNILVTGGGAVKGEANRQSLRLNGFVAHITRDIRKLPTKGRPLSQGADALQTLWRERQPLYQAVADITVKNETTPEKCAREIWEAMHEAVCD